MKYLKFNIKLSLYLTTAFVIMTVVGTLTHELGHYSVSKILGYEARINYMSSRHWDNEKDKFISETFTQYSNEIKNGLDFPNKDKYLEVIDKYQADNFWITLGGPIQTMLTGTIGLGLLIAYRKRFILSNKVYIIGWVLIFTSLFWLRQVANLFMAVIGFITKGEISPRGDEMRLAYYLDINIWSIQIITGILGLAVLLLVLKFMPKNLVITFIISGLVGGVLGYYLWIIKFGRIIMP